MIPHYKFKLPGRWPALAASLGAIILAGCDEQALSSGKSNPPASKAGAGNLQQRRMMFLNRIRDADPDGRTIDRALLNEQNELGLVLDRRVEMERIPDLMRTMLTQMSHEFPGEDLAVLAYAPSNPPRKIGTARLDARTRDMTYTPEP
jgi:hypothetical protein